MQGVDLTTVLINGGAAGVLLLLFMLDWIVRRPGVARIEKEVEEWKQLYKDECEAHEVTRRAHVEKIEPGLAAATEAARTAAHMLGSIKAIHQGDHEERP